MSPEQKARIVRILRGHGRAVGFLGDGVNDALALHGADVVVLVAVVEGRRIFANTVKDVLMGTSSPFGTMVSAAAASAFRAFLPMLPSHLLLDNLLSDAGQLAIPTDRVDDEQLRAPAR